MSLGLGFSFCYPTTSFLLTRLVSLTLWICLHSNSTSQLAEYEC
ncbi:hypothetical protein OROGR_028448 [Orobanche gracilis]